MQTKRYFAPLFTITTIRTISQEPRSISQEKNQKDTTLKKRKAIRYSIHKVQVDIAFIRRGTIPAPTKISN